jgi:hypothetical protein
MSEKKKKPSTWTVAKTLMFLFAVIILPAGSFLYLRFGLDYYIERLDELGDLGQVPAFVSVNQYGDTITEANMKGNMTVVGYFSGDCGISCDSFANEFQRIQAAFPENYKIKLFSYYTDSSQASLVDDKEEGSKWHWLKGEVGALDSMFQTGYKMPVIEHYSNQFALVDSSMVIRRLYDATDLNEVNRLVVHLAMAAPRPPKKVIQFKRAREK